MSLARLLLTTLFVITLCLVVSTVLKTQAEEIPGDLSGQWQERKDQCYPYLTKVEKHVRRNWAAPKETNERQSGTTVVKFKISRDGQLVSSEITKSSPIAGMDQETLKAIEHTAPFKPIPPECVCKHLTIEMTFNYDYYPNTLQGYRDYTLSRLRQLK